MSKNWYSSKSSQSNRRTAKSEDNRPIFVGENFPKEIECAICLDSFKNPIESRECKHIFCRECLKTLEICPLCRKKFIGFERPNRLILNLAEQVVVTCSKCGWKGTRRESYNHKCLENAVITLSSNNNENRQTNSTSFRQETMLEVCHTRLQQRTVEHSQQPLPPFANQTSNVSMQHTTNMFGEQAVLSEQYANFPGNNPNAYTNVNQNRNVPYNSYNPNNAFYSNSQATVPFQNMLPTPSAPSEYESEYNQRNNSNNNNVSNMNWYNVENQNHNSPSSAVNSQIGNNNGWNTTAPYTSALSSNSSNNNNNNNNNSNNNSNNSHANTNTTTNNNNFNDSQSFRMNRFPPEPQATQPAYRQQIFTNEERRPAGNEGRAEPTEQQQPVYTNESRERKRAAQRENMCKRKYEIIPIIGDEPWINYHLEEEEYNKLIEEMEKHELGYIFEVERKNIPSIARIYNLRREEEDINKIFEDMGKKYSKSLRFDEVLTWLRWNKPKSHRAYNLTEQEYANLMNEFYTFDHNRNGKLLKQKFADMLLTLHDVRDRWVAISLMDMIAVEKDFLDINEFLAFKTGKIIPKEYE